MAHCGLLGLQRLKLWRRLWRQRRHGASILRQDENRLLLRRRRRRTSSLFALLAAATPRNAAAIVHAFGISGANAAPTQDDDQDEPNKDEDDERLRQRRRFGHGRCLIADQKGICCCFKTHTALAKRTAVCALRSRAESATMSIRVPWVSSFRVADASALVVVR